MSSLGIKVDRPLERVTEHEEFEDILRDELQTINVPGAGQAIIFEGPMKFTFDARIPKFLIDEAVRRAMNRLVASTTARTARQVADHGLVTPS